MLECVGESLLDDAVGGKVEAGGQRALGAVHDEVDGKPGIAVVLDQRPDVLERRPRLELPVRRHHVPAQDTEQTPHLRERLPSRLLDPQQRLFRALGALVEQQACGPRLDGHHADRVGDDIVQLARDA